MQLLNVFDKLRKTLSINTEVHFHNSTVSYKMNVTILICTIFALAALRPTLLRRLKRISSSI